MKKSIIVPVYNEEGNIGNLIDKINNKLENDDELIVVNDGSTDNTELEIKSKNCILISLSENKGKGFAMRKGILEATGDLIIFMGGDGQDDPNEIDNLIEEINNGNDYVIGSRFLTEEHNKNRYSDKAILPVNEFGNKSITFIINFLFKIKLTDAAGATKMIKMSEYKKYSFLTNEFDFEFDVLCRFAKNKKKINEFHSNYKPRTYKEGKKLRAFKDGFAILKVIIINYFMNYEK